ncbi:hypothetical protein [Aquipuribacter nitratireducens]|uniref:Uncharacterized protein n=1 Tax=Aquipuribacter nitratireducens TaxID=650104 RepID=A0ABW0GS22_9MICO
MTIGAIPAGGGDVGGPAGYSYRLVVVRGERDAVLARASALGFSGWVGPQEGEHVVLVPAGRGPTVASDAADLESFAASLAADLNGSPTTVLAAEVVRDRLLELLCHVDGGPLLRYRSDPSVVDDEAFDEPVGQHHADALAAAFGRPKFADAVREELGETLDPEQHIESERLDHVLGRLGVPTWGVSAWRLPKYVPYGPDTRELVRLRAGRRGFSVRGALEERLRGWSDRLRRRAPGPRRDVDMGGPAMPDEMFW